mmetsp:Transcript_37653/g.93217  ORF Transcript_37653/g.93217 Transcript_37653/m.93217 type:complete len:238 (+) Transcript_37653:209-922(+)
MQSVTLSAPLGWCNKYMQTLRRENDGTSRTCRATASIKYEYLQSTSSMHFLGIGGSGLSALAVVALSQGYAVSGSDLKRSPQLELVQAEGAICYIGHISKNVGSCDTGRLSTVPGDVQLTTTVPDAIIVSSAVPERNVEILSAKQVGVPVYNRSQWLARITKKMARIMSSTLCLLVTFGVNKRVNHIKLSVHRRWWQWRELMEKQRPPQCSLRLCESVFEFYFRLRLPFDFDLLPFT